MRSLRLLCDTVALHQTKRAIERQAALCRSLKPGEVTHAFESVFSNSAAPDIVSQGLDAFARARDRHGF